MALSGRLPKSQLLGYLIAQFAGALAASFVLLTLLKGIPEYDLATHHLGANGNPRHMDVTALFGWEVLMTALFLLTIFTVTRKGADPGFHAYAIGGFLFVSHLVGAPLGDSSLNPARSFGPAMLEGGPAREILWLYIAAPIVGGLIGWQLFNLLHNEKQ
jgi:aquaporin Z